MERSIQGLDTAIQARIDRGETFKERAVAELKAIIFSMRNKATRMGEDGVSVDITPSDLDGYSKQIRALAESLKVDRFKVTDSFEGGRRSSRRYSRRKRR